jgi:DNA polymerase (family X)
VLSNAEIAHRLTSLAQLLSTQRENPFKIKAYRRAAETITHLPESIDALVRSGADLTAYAGIGPGIASALREIVLSGTLQKIETLRASVSPELAALSEYPRLDPKRVLQAYKKLGIASVDALKASLESGEVGRRLGVRMEQHLRRALTETHEILLHDAHELARAVQRFLLKKAGATRAELAGDYRRRVEVIGELVFVIETQDFAAVIAQLKTYAGGTELVSTDGDSATFKLSAGILLRLQRATPRNWGRALLLATGSDAHLRLLEKRPGGRKLASRRGGFPTEAAVYRDLGLRVVEPELRVGDDEIGRAAARKLPPALITREKIRGDLHAHTTSSDGAHSIEQMALAARERGYSYLGITDHSQSLKIAGGLSEADLWKQIRRIDRLNAKLPGFRILKSAEVDIHEDGRLDYPDDLLRELDYTVCSIHSRFALNRAQQTERILRAMDHPRFNVLGHATGRLLLRRPGYEIEIERIVAHAKAAGCFFEINSSPDRLDLSADYARLARKAGVKIAICTDAHSIRELDYIEGGIEQARRAGLTACYVLNSLSWRELERTLRR